MRKQAVRTLSRAERRLILRATLDQVSRMIGVGPATLWRWEAGRNRPTAEQAEAWERALCALEAARQTREEAR